MKVIRGSFSFERDLDRVRMFLLDIYKQTGSLHYLIPIKVENQKYGPCGPKYSPRDDDAIKIWRISDKEDSEIIAVSHRGSAGNYHIEIHPDYKHMEKELYLEVENLEKMNIGDAKSRMYTYTVGPDRQRAQVLTELGYTDRGLHEYNYEFPQNKTIPDISLPGGYSIRSLRGEEDYPDYVDVFGSVYDHCRQHMTVERMKFMTKAEFYSDNLNLIVADDTGRFVGFCMYRLDPLTGIAEMEALGVRREFENLGLEGPLLSEGLKRLLKMQPNLICCVEVGKSEPLNEILQSIGFLQTVTMNQWFKDIE